MARKFITDQILKLYSKLGGNVSEVLGTRSNINFLGVGKSPEGFIDSTINIDAIGALGKNKVLEELKSSIGYLTADKLNDVQANKLLENMTKIDQVFNPKQIPNITDMATGTRDLTQEGLGALRAEPLRPPKEPLDLEKATINPVVRGDVKIDDFKQIVDELDLPPPGSRGAADDIAAPFQDAETTIRNLEAQEAGLGKQFENIVTNKGNAPAKRASAREFLVEALKKDTLDPATSGFGKTNLNDVVSAEDVKLITEGGGGIGGDPLVLVEKYFGPRIVELIPDERITPRFINRLLTNVRDNAGRAPDDPRFDRFTATLINEDIPFAEGGRAGFRLGGITNSLLKKLNTKKIKAAVDNIFETGDYKYDAELAAESLVEMNPQLFGGKLYDDLDDMIKLDVYDLVLKEVSQRNALKIQARRGKAAAAKELEQKSVLSEYKPKKFDAANGGLAKILEV